ncbi:MAG: hypothetical protein KAI64_01960, partial [Thermoplasmata archaeon]|nr:hypothetical protein [Thermoplasmata archaeon]
NCQFDENWGRCIEIISGGGGGVSTSGDISVVEKEGGGAFNGNVYEWIYVRDNVIDEHKGTSGFINIVGVAGAHNGTETLIIERNTYTSTTPDPPTGRPTFITINGKDVIEITNNTFTDNIAGFAMNIVSNGGDEERSQPASILIANNDFIGNTIWHTTEIYGIISATWGGNLEITQNKVSDDSSRAFLNIRDVPQYAAFSNLHLHHNEFVDSPDMTGVIYLYNFDVYNNLLNVIVEENLIRDCGRATVMDFYDQPVLDLEDNDPTIVFRNNTVMNALGEVINIYGNLRIEDNTFTNCHGYVLNLPYLGKYIPTIERNTFSNCHDLIYVGGKAKNLGGLPMVMEDLEVDCTGNAFRFNNMQA